MGKPKQKIVQAEVPVSVGLLAPAELAVGLGVAVEVVRGLMREHCLMPVDAQMDRVAGEVRLTAEGVTKLRALVDAQMTPTTVTEATRPAVLVIWRLHGARRVLADLEGLNRRVLCCLKSTENLMPGMRLEGAREGEDGLWFYTGRMPRRKGCW